MRKDIIDRQLILVIILCTFALFLYVKTSDDPLIDFLNGSCIESLFLKLEIGNSLLKDLSIGILVSTIFWTFNNYLPSRKLINQKIGRLNRALYLILESFKGNPFHHDKHYINCRELNINDLSAIKHIKELLDSKKIYGSMGEKCFFEICSESYDLFKFLSIAANEISPEHGALWDSLTRNITVIGRLYDQWFEDRAKEGIKAGVDYSKGTLWLNLTEILEALEKWMELNNK
ncbi:hypothetical protein [Acinetobacter sp. YH01020]|uniref:hypothetical protein n=1 Tax=Acinetobacter sp. YH01020 TaxID=2601034 RepID=UPI0015D24490|nr:hypothetical protein [Acinetobacter sp. YH01020]